VIHSSIGKTEVAVPCWSAGRPSSLAKQAAKECAPARTHHLIHSLSTEVTNSRVERGFPSARPSDRLPAAATAHEVTLEYGTVRSTGHQQSAHCGATAIHPCTVIVVPDIRIDEPDTPSCERGDDGPKRNLPPWQPPSRRVAGLSCLSRSEQLECPPNWRGVFDGRLRRSRR
jgi:hypothetical protein